MKNFIFWAVMLSYWFCYFYDSTIEIRYDSNNINSEYEPVISQFSHVSKNLDILSTIRNTSKELSLSQNLLSKTTIVKQEKDL